MSTLHYSYTCTLSEFERQLVAAHNPDSTDRRFILRFVAQVQFDELSLRRDPDLSSDRAFEVQISTIGFLTDSITLEGTDIPTGAYVNMTARAGEPTIDFAILGDPLDAAHVGREE